MKTSIRLALTSLAVGCITFAASGAPLPFLDQGHKPTIGLSAPLPPLTPDGAPPQAPHAFLTHNQP